MKTLMNRVLSLFTVLALVGAAQAIPVVTNKIVVSASGAIATPVPLHQESFRNYLNDEDPGRYANYVKSDALSKRYNNPMVTWITDGTHSQYFVNLYPGSNYQWQVGSYSGTFTAEDLSPRTLLVPTIGKAEVWNFRDLGGGRLIGSRRRAKYGVYYRSSHWDAYFNCQSICPMNSVFGIRSEIDLRSDASMTVYTDYPEYDGTIDNERYIKNGVVFTNSPSLPQGDDSVRFFKLPIDQSFQKKSASNWSSNIRKIFHVFGQQRYLPSVFHCAGGKDRTENIAFHLLALCGVEFDDIVRDDATTAFAIGSAGMYSPDYYRTNLSNGDYDKYGTNLAARARAYLESLGVTKDELSHVTMSLVGERLDSVLARVNYYAEHKALLPLEDDHDDEGFEDPEGGGSEGGESEGGGTEGGGSEGEDPVVSGRPGTRITDSSVVRRGGDEVYRISEDGTDYYVHYFTSSGTFSNLTDDQLSIQYLVVGGGGAGGDSGGNNNTRWGGGGGGGGGVCGGWSDLSAGAKWTVSVGVGGEPFDQDGNHIAYNVVRTPAGESSIVLGEVDVARAPGGGAGGCTTSSPAAQAGAAGGGASAYYKSTKRAAGTYGSVLDGIVYEKFSGGLNTDVAVASSDGDGGTLAGGGGGAGGQGGDGDASRRASGDGGRGISSSITGEEVEYGAGGGGGGGAISSVAVPFGGDYANGYAYGVIPGEGANGGGRGGDTFAAAQSGAPGTGCGGGGASAGRANSGRGGSGIVIIRYAVGGSSEPQTTYWTVTFTTNGVTVSTASVEDGKKLSSSQIPFLTGGSWDSDLSAATITGNTTFNYTISVTPGPEPQEDAPWAYGSRKYDFRKSDSDGVLGAEANWRAGSAFDYAIFRVYDSGRSDSAKDLSLAADWTVPQFDFGHPSYYPYTGALALGDYTLACTKSFNVMTGNVVRVTSGTIRLDDIGAAAHIGWNPGNDRMGGNAGLVLDGPEATFVSTSANGLQVGCYPGPNCRVEVLNGARFEAALGVGYAREKGGTWDNVFLASGKDTVVDVRTGSTHIGMFGWDDGVRTWGNSLIVTDGAKMYAKTIYIGSGDARESTNNVFEVSNGATLEMTGDDRVVYVSRNGCEGNMMKIENTTLNAEPGSGREGFEIWMCPSNNGILQVSGTNTSVLLGRTQRFPAKTTLAFDLTGPQVGDKAMMTAVNYEFDPESTIRITSSADLAGVGPFAVKVLTNYSYELNAIPDGVIKIDPAFEVRFVIDTTTDPKSLIVRYTGGEPAPEEAGWEDAETAGDSATAADVWGAAVPADLAGVSAKKLAAWATAKEVAFAAAAAIKAEAFLLNCANTDAAVAKAKDEFRFTSITPGEVPEIEGDFNGTVTVKGSTDLKTWDEAKADDKFYKAVLE